MMWKAIQGDAIQTARIHPAVHPGNRDDSCSHGKRDLGWTEPRSREPSQSALSYKHFKNFTKDLEVNKARYRKPGQPGQPGSYEEALNHNPATEFD